MSDNSTVDRLAGLSTTTSSSSSLPETPTLDTYETPDVGVTTGSVDSSKFGYQAPSTDFQQHDLNQGLLDYDPSSSKNLTFDGRDIDASAIGANVKQTTPDFATSDNYLTDGAFVENRVTGLLEDDNPLTQRAEANGLAAANSIGLANTSMGATIGQTAVLDRALEIATPDATTQATADTTRQAADYGAQGKVQDTENTASLATQQGLIEGALQSQAGGIDWDANTQKAAIQGDLNEQAANITGAQTTQKEQYAADSQVRSGLLEGALAEQQGNITGEIGNVESQNTQNLTILKDKLNAAYTTTEAKNALAVEVYQQGQENYRMDENNAVAMQMEEYKQAAAAIQGDADRFLQEVISQTEISASQTQTLATNFSQEARDFEISVQNILLDQNLTDESKNSAITVLVSTFNQNVSAMASLFGVKWADAETKDFVEEEEEEEETEEVEEE